ncbi:MAG: hypothetical protein M1825_004654 [Sarcosagium campestre]|nr:MAG: hypothetical protein M1825_004654 [Sarcosagium campestre]
MDKVKHILNPGKEKDDEVLYGSGQIDDPVLSGYTPGTIATAKKISQGAGGAQSPTSGDRAVDGSQGGIAHPSEAGQRSAQSASAYDSSYTQHDAGYDRPIATQDHAYASTGNTTTSSPTSSNKDKPLPQPPADSVHPTSSGQVASSEYSDETKHRDGRNRLQKRDANDHSAAIFSSGQSQNHGNERPDGQGDPNDPKHHRGFLGLGSGAKSGDREYETRDDDPKHGKEHGGILGLGKGSKHHDSKDSSKHDDTKREKEHHGFLGLGGGSKNNEKEEQNRLKHTEKNEGPLLDENKHDKEHRGFLGLGKSSKDRGKDEVGRPEYVGDSVRSGQDQTKLEKEHRGVTGVGDNTKLHGHDEAHGPRYIDDRENYPANEQKRDKEHRGLLGLGGGSKKHEAEDRSGPAHSDRRESPRQDEEKHRKEHHGFLGLGGGSKSHEKEETKSDDHAKEVKENLGLLGISPARKTQGKHEHIHDGEKDEKEHKGLRGLLHLDKDKSKDHTSKHDVVPARVDQSHTAAAPTRAENLGTTPTTHQTQQDINPSSKGTVEQGIPAEGSGTNQGATYGAAGLAGGALIGSSSERSREQDNVSGQERSFPLGQDLTAHSSSQDHSFQSPPPVPPKQPLSQTDDPSVQSDRQAGSVLDRPRGTGYADTNPTIQDTGPSTSTRPTVGEGEPFESTTDERTAATSVDSRDPVQQNTSINESGYEGTNPSGDGKSFFAGPSGTAVGGPHKTVTANRLDPNITATGLPGSQTSTAGRSTASDSYPHQGHLARSAPLAGSTSTTSERGGPLARGAESSPDTTRKPVGSQQQPLATAESGPASRTAGPHSSNLLNKLDPRIDSDLDGSRTIGSATNKQDAALQHGQGSTESHSISSPYSTSEIDPRVDANPQRNTRGGTQGDDPAAISAARAATNTRSGI